MDTLECGGTLALVVLFAMLAYVPLLGVTRAGLVIIVGNFLLFIINNYSLWAVFRASNMTFLFAIGTEYGHPN